MDNVGDALIRLKNGYLVGKREVSIRYSKLTLNLMKLLEKEGYVATVTHKEREILVTLKYADRKPAITDIKRVSKPSLRVYSAATKLPYVLNGLGLAVISTPKGLMTEKQARKSKLGGEVLAFVW